MSQSSTLAERTPGSLRGRLTLLTGVLTFGLLLFSWLLVTVASQHFAERHSQAVLTTVSRELLEEMQPVETAEEDFPEMLEEIQEAAAQTSEHLVILHVRDQQIISRSHRDGPSWPAQEERDWCLSILPFHGDQLVLGLYFGDAQDDLDRQALILGIFSLSCFFLITVGAWFLVGRVLEPISLLAEQAVEAESNPKTRLVSPSNDKELTQLVFTLNQYLDRLAHYSAARSRFYASASHELRTPLQALSGHLELALSRPREEHEYQESLIEAKAQSDRLIRLTQDLLTLNRLETQSETHRETVDLAEICENVWYQFQRTATEKELKVDLNLPTTHEVWGSPSYLAIVCRNLLENAVKYTPRGGTITVDLSEQALSVVNDCPPIPADGFEKLMEPFYRYDRQHGQGSNGNGLGLPMVASIAQNEGWALHLEQKDGRFRAEIVL